jgi:hypothetical protein
MSLLLGLSPEAQVVSAMRLSELVDRAADRTTQTILRVLWRPEALVELVAPVVLEEPQVR